MVRLLTVGKTKPRQQKQIMENVVRQFASIFTAIALLLAAVSVSASDLDSDTINNWANTMEDIEVWAQENEISDQDMVDPDDPTNLESSMARAASNHEGMQDIISSHGFNNGDEWASTGARIVNAYGAVVMEEDQAGTYEDMEQQMQAQMQQLEEDPNISEEQLAMIREQMDNALAMMQRMSDAPEGDKEAVRANRSRLDEVFEQQQP